MAINHSYPDYLDLRERNRSFDDLAAYNVTAAGLDTGNNPTSAWILETTGNYFDALGIQPYLGRFFHAADEHGPNSAPYIVLTYAYWHSHFQDDRGVVGRTVQLNKHPFTILGVAPPEFRGTLMLCYPGFLGADGESGADGRHERFGCARKPRAFDGDGTSEGGRDNGTGDCGSQLHWDLPGKNLSERRRQHDLCADAAGVGGRLAGKTVAGVFAGLLMLAGLILLAACANLGSLFAARAADRSKEIALRLALGSSPARILRQLFTEAAVISLMGGALGLWGSVACCGALSVWQPLPTAPLQIPVNADANVYIVALVLSLVSGLLFGVVPVRQVLHTDPYQVIKSGSTATKMRRDLGARFVAGGTGGDLRAAGDFFAGGGARAGAVAAQQFRI